MNGRSKRATVSCEFFSQKEKTYCVNSFRHKAQLQPIISIESNENSRSLTARKTEKMEPRIHAPTADSKSKANGFGSCRRRAEVAWLTVARTPLPFNATHSSHPILAGAAPVSQISPAACGRVGRRQSRSLSSFLSHPRHIPPTTRPLLYLLKLRHKEIHQQGLFPGVYEFWPCLDEG